jgi:hypothetical protein
VGRRTLLDDGNMLLGDGHLYEKSRSVMLVVMESEQRAIRTVSVGRLSFGRRSLSLSLSSLTIQGHFSRADFLA